MLFWIKHIRKIILIFSAAIAILIYWHFYKTTPFVTLRDIQLTQTYALTALTYLYLSLLASPLYAVFSKFPLRTLYIKARRAIGFSAFCFAALHACFAFFTELGGFNGLQFLDTKYLTAIIFSGTALLILTAMAATSFDYMAKKLGRNWKRLHRFVYLAGFLILAHFLLIGSDFANLAKTVPSIAIAAILFLLSLEAIRFERYLVSKQPGLKKIHLSFIIIVAMIILVGYIYIVPNAYVQHHH